MALAAVLFPSPARAVDKGLTILYTGALRGELEPCGCSPETQSGGLARLSGYISANQKALSPYILVDAGDTFAAETAQGTLKNEAVVRSFEIMGYDAVAPVLLKSGKPVKVARGGVAVNISADELGLKKGALNILLSGRPVEELGAVKGWDVIVTSSGEVLEVPVSASGAVIVSGYPKGQKLGVLSVRVDSKGRVAGSSHRWQDLKLDVEEDQRVRSVLKEYDRKVAELLKEEELKAPADGPYIGAKRCAECHQPFDESWKGTRHSGAFATLERVGKSKDPECVVCHVVGYGEEGGFLSLKATPELAGVQCESCHGPGREHAVDFGPMRPVAAGVCARCHTPENSPSFDYGKYLERIKH